MNHLNPYSRCAKAGAATAAMMLAIASASSVFGAVAVSEPFAGVAASFPGTDGTGSKYTLFSPPVVRPIVTAGKATSINANVLTDANAIWANDQFNGVNGAHFVEFDSGDVVNVLSTDGAAKSLLLAANIQGTVAPGVSYRVRKHLTIAAIFGPENAAGLLAGGNASEADNILIAVPETQQTLTVFYSNVPEFEGWYFADYSGAADYVVRPGQGLLVERKTSGNALLYLNGLVKNTATKLPVAEGYNLVGTLKVSSAIPLADLNLYTAGSSTGIAGGFNYSSADNVLFISPSGATTTYFYSTVPGFVGWYDSTYTAAGTTLIAPGSAFLIHRKAGNGVFTWTIPAE